MKVIEKHLLTQANRDSLIVHWIAHPPLSFVVCLCGFRLKDPFYGTVYRTKIQTPMRHVFGELDSMVYPSDTLDLATHCENAVTFAFSGAHRIPRNIGHFPLILNDFVRRASGKGDEDESNWIDKL